MMKLEFDRAKRELVQSEEIEGLFKATYRHKLEANGTDSNILYTGPKLPTKIWSDIVGFCRWTYEEHKCESQVRLFVDLKEKTWVAWAFPQEIEAGLHTKELDGRLFDVQRESLPNAQDLVPYGTVHHHCSAGAFQSGTDHEDEKNQDGLHITLGNMEKPVPDLHSRLSMNGSFYIVNLSAFWNIGALDDDRLVPRDMRSKIAEYQMINTDPAKDFPEEWRKNMIRKLPAIIYSGFGTLGVTGGNGSTTAGGVVAGNLKSEPEKVLAAAKRAEAGVAELLKEYATLEFLSGHLEELGGMPLFLDLVRIAREKEIHASDLFDWVEDTVESMERKGEMDEISKRIADASAKWEPKYHGNNSEGKPSYVIKNGDQMSVQRWDKWGDADEAAKKENDADIEAVWNHDGMGYGS